MARSIVLINGNPDTSVYQLNSFLDDTIEHLTDNGLQVRHHMLSRKRIGHCRGCWNCWLNTPGICRFQDDAPEILRDIMNSAVLVFASPVIMGMYSALLKRFQDRMLPLVHPYTDIVRGEIHHRKRYPSYPRLGIILENSDATREEMEMIRFIYNRLAINLHTEVVLFHSIHQTTPREVSYEISRI